MKLICQECGKKFKSGSDNPHCPKCGSYDVDLAESKVQEHHTWDFYPGMSVRVIAGKFGGMSGTVTEVNSGDNLDMIEVELEPTEDFEGGTHSFTPDSLEGPAMVSEVRESKGLNMAKKLNESGGLPECPNCGSISVQFDYILEPAGRNDPEHYDAVFAGAGQRSHRPEVYHCEVCSEQFYVAGWDGNGTELYAYPRGVEHRGDYPFDALGESLTESQFTTGSYVRLSQDGLDFYGPRTMSLDSSSRGEVLEPEDGDGVVCVSWNNGSFTDYHSTQFIELDPGPYESLEEGNHRRCEGCNRFMPITEYADGITNRCSTCQQRAFSKMEARTPKVTYGSDWEKPHDGWLFPTPPVSDWGGRSHEDSISRWRGLTSVDYVGVQHLENGGLPSGDWAVLPFSDIGNGELSYAGESELCQSKEEAYAVGREFASAIGARFHGEVVWDREARVYRLGQQETRFKIVGPYPVHETRQGVHTMKLTVRDLIEQVARGKNVQAAVRAYLGEGDVLPNGPTEDEIPTTGTPTSGVEGEADSTPLSLADPTVASDEPGEAEKKAKAAPTDGDNLPFAERYRKQAKSVLDKFLKEEEDDEEDDEVEESDDKDSDDKEDDKPEFLKKKEESRRRRAALEAKLRKLREEDDEDEDDVEEAEDTDSEADAENPPVEESDDEDEDDEDKKEESRRASLRKRVEALRRKATPRVTESDDEDEDDVEESDDEDSDDEEKEESRQMLRDRKSGVAKEARRTRRPFVKEKVDAKDTADPQIQIGEVVNYTGSEGALGQGKVIQQFPHADGYIYSVAFENGQSMMVPHEDLRRAGGLFGEGKKRRSGLKESSGATVYLSHSHNSLYHTALDRESLHAKPGMQVVSGYVDDPDYFLYLGKGRPSGAAPDEWDESLTYGFEKFMATAQNLQVLESKAKG